MGVILSSMLEFGQEELESRCEQGFRIEGDAHQHLQRRDPVREDGWHVCLLELLIGLCILDFGGFYVVAPPHDEVDHD